MEDRRRGPRRLLVHVGHTWMPLPVGEWVIGRAPESDIRIDDDKVSRRHALVRALPSGWELEDGTSLNGIWLDGRQVQRLVIPPGGVTVLFGGRDGVPVRLLPDRAGTVPDLPPAVGGEDADAGSGPAPGTSPAGVRFEHVTPQWTAPEPAAGAPPAGEELGPRRLRSFVRQAGRLVGRRDPAD
jgi:ABC transport system ATP-binding/permease protein